MHLPCVLCITLLTSALVPAAQAGAVKLSIDEVSDGALRFFTKTRYFDVDVEVVQIAEFGANFTKAAIDWENINSNGDNTLQAEAQNWVTSFTYTGQDEYAYNTASGVSFTDGVSAEVRAERESQGNALLIARMGRAMDDATISTEIGGNAYDMEVEQGAYKIDLITEWSTLTDQQNYLVLEILVSWEVDIAAFAQDTILSGNIPEIDADLDGNCVDLQIASGAYSFCFNDIPLKCYNSTTGGSQSPPAGDEIMDTSVGFSVEAGKRKGVNEGSLRLFLVIFATSNDESVTIPERCELDPTSYGENSAGALSSWLYWL